MFDGVASSHMAFAAAMVDMMRSKEPNEKKEPKKAAAPAAFDPELLARLAQQANEVPEEPPEPDPPEPPPSEPEPPPPSFNLPPGFTVVTFDTETEAQQAMAEMGDDDVPLGEAESNGTPAIGFGRGWAPVGQEPEGPEKTEKVRNIVDNVMGTLKATAASSLAASKVAPPAAKPTHTRPLVSAAVPAADLYLPGGTRGVGATVIGQTDAKDSQADKDGARDRRDERGGDNSDRRYRSRSRGGRRSRSNRRGGRSRSNRRDGGRQRGRWSRSPRRAEPAKPPRRNTGFTSAPADPNQVVAAKPAGNQFSDEMNNVQLKASEVPDWLQDLANPQPRTHGRKVLRMPDTYIKCLIGKGGETIRSIINRTGADIQIEGKSTDSEANVSIAGNVEPAENLIRDILKSKGCPWQTQSGTILQRGGAVPLTTVGWKPDVDTDDIQIPTELVGLFIGNAGAGLKEIKQRCGAGNFIKILPDILPGGLQCIQVVGDNWRNAREQVRQKVEEIKKLTPGRWHAPAFRKNDPNHGGSNAGVATADHTGGYMSSFGATPGYNSGHSHMGVRSVINPNQNWGAGSTLI